MAKATKGGKKKSKPAKKKSSGKKAKSVKAKKTPKAKPAVKVTPAKVEAPAVKVTPAKVEKPIVVETPKAQPIVVEVPKQPTSAPAPTPASAPTPEKLFENISDEAKNSALALDNLINSHRSPMRKEDVDKFLADNSQIQVLPIYSASGYYLDIYELGKKVLRLPFTGEYTLAV